MTRKSGAEGSHATSTTRKSRAAAAGVATRPMPAVPMDEVLSFLKDTRGALTWTLRDLSESLKISDPKAKEVISILELQGYVRHEKDHQENDGAWITTLNGQTLSGSTQPRFRREQVEEAVSALAKRLRELNSDPSATFHVARAVAFGDFLSGRPRAQAADVGVQLAPRSRRSGKLKSEPRARDALKSLRAGSALIKIRPYEKWMSDRSNRKLV